MREEVEEKKTRKGAVEDVEIEKKKKEGHLVLYLSESLPTIPRPACGNPGSSAQAWALCSQVGSAPVVFPVTSETPGLCLQVFVPVVPSERKAFQLFLV